MTGESRSTANQELRNWHPTPAEVHRIVVEMRPIIQEFARLARESQAAHATP